MNNEENKNNELETVEEKKPIIIEAPEDAPVEPTAEPIVIEEPKVEELTSVVTEPAPAAEPIVIEEPKVEEPTSAVTEPAPQPVQQPTPVPQPMEKSFCPNCGTPSNGPFCPNCGYKIK